MVAADRVNGIASQVVLGIWHDRIMFGSSYLTQRLDLPLVERSITLISAYGSYLLTEELGGSGFIGVAIAGLILGNFGSRIGMNPRTRLAVTEFWDFLAFFVNSILFLLIGDQVSFTTGYRKRNLMAKVTEDYFDGSAGKAETVMGWNRRSVQLGLNERRTGFRCVNNY